MRQSRRAFLAKASAAGAGLAITGMKMKQQSIKAKEGFGIKIYATRWDSKARWMNSVGW